MYGDVRRNLGLHETRKFFDGDAVRLRVRRCMLAYRRQRRRRQRSAYCISSAESRRRHRSRLQGDALAGRLRHRRRHRLHGRSDGRRLNPAGRSSVRVDGRRRKPVPRVHVFVGLAPPADVRPQVLRHLPVAEVLDGRHGSSAERDRRRRLDLLFRDRRRRRPGRTRLEGGRDERRQRLLRRPADGCDEPAVLRDVHHLRRIWRHDRRLLREDLRRRSPTPGLSLPAQRSEFEDGETAQDAGRRSGCPGWAASVRSVRSLFVVCIAFYLAYVPGQLNNVGFETPPWYLAASRWLLFSSSTTNGLLYVVLSKSIRRKFWLMFCGSRDGSARRIGQIVSNIPRRWNWRLLCGTRAGSGGLDRLREGMHMVDVRSPTEAMDRAV